MVEIFRKYVAGASPRAKAADLNARGVRSPRGGTWNASIINSNADRGNGVIHNELYRGVLAFGRQTWLKDRSTGARNARKGDPASIVRQEVPALRIAPEDLWLKVRARYEENRLCPQKTSPLASARPRHLLSGKLTCGWCGGPMIRSGSEQRFVCSWRRERGPAACDNGRGVKGPDISGRVLAALRDRLLAPDIVASAMEEARLEMEKHNREVRSRRGDGLFTYAALRSFEKPYISAWWIRLFGGVMLGGDPNVPGFASPDLFGLIGPRPIPELFADVR